MVFVARFQSGQNLYADNDPNGNQSLNMLVNAINSVQNTDNISATPDGFYLAADGTDDAPSFTRAAASLGATGGTLRLLPRKYWIQSAVVFTTPITLQGSGSFEVQQTTAEPTGAGTWIKITTTGFTPFTWSGSGSTGPRGSAVRDLSVWQSHPTPSTAQVSTTITTTLGSVTATVASAAGISIGQYVGGTSVVGGTTVANLVGTTVTLSRAAITTQAGGAAYFVNTWAPTVYPVVFYAAALGGSFTIERVFGYCVYDLFWSDNSGRIWADQIKGQIFHTAIKITQNYDVTRIGWVHVWGFATAAINVRLWMQANADAVVLGKIDGLRINDVFATGCNAAVRLISTDTSGTGAPTVTEFTMNSIYGDYCRYAVLVEGSPATGYIGHIFHYGAVSGSTGFSGPILGSTAYLATGDNSAITLSRITTIGCGGSSIRLAGSGNDLIVVHPQQLKYNWDDLGFAAIQCDKGITDSNYVTILHEPSYGGQGTTNVHTSGNGASAGAFTGGVSHVPLAFDGGGGVNGVSFTMPPTGNSVAVTAYGTDTNVGIRFGAKGTSALSFYNSNGFGMTITPVASATCWPAMIGGAGSPAVIGVAGLADASLLLQGVGIGGAILGAAGKTIGFYGASPAAKQTVTGAKGGNAALGSLLTALANMGIITDSSTA